MPPIAAMSGIAARRRSRRAPKSNSRLASSPITRKKNVMRPWFTHSRRSSDMPSPPSRIERSVVQTDSYELDHGEFAHSSATTAAVSNATAPPDSVARKSRTGAARFRAHAVRPLNDVAGCWRALRIDRDVLDVRRARWPVESIEVPVDQRAQRQKPLADERLEPLLELRGGGSAQSVEQEEEAGE